MNDPLPLEIESTLGVHEVQPSKVEHIQFKRRKIANVRYRDYTNPSGKLFKVNDPCEVDPLCPYDKDQYRSFNRWLACLVYNIRPIEMGVSSNDVMVFHFEVTWDVA